MADSKNKPVVGLRTFASDLDEQRKMRKDSPEKVPVEIPEVKMADAENHIAKAAAGNTVTRNSKQEEVLEKPEVVVEPKKQIPSFHEIQKEASKIHAKKESVLEKVDGIRSLSVDGEGASSATIITDTQKDRFKLFPSIAASIKHWFESVNKNLKKSKTPTYSVPDASLRKGVIQKAATKTGATFSASSDELRERIRQRKNAEPLQESKSETTWTPFTDSGYSLLEEENEAPQQVDNTENIQVEFKNVTTYDTVPTEDVENETRDEWVNEDLAENLEDINIEDAGDIDVEPKEKDQASVTVNTPPVKVETETLYQEPEFEEENKTFLEKFDTNTLTLVILGAFIGFIAMFFISRFAIETVIPSYESGQEQVIDPVTLLTKAPQERLLLTMLSPEGIKEILKNTQTTSGTTLHEIGFRHSVTKQPLYKSTVVDLLEIKIPHNLESDIQQIHLAISNRPDRSLIIQIINNESARGNMLAWEKTIVSDMENLFSQPRSTSTYKFIDEQIDLIDVRSFVNLENEASLVYGFLGERVIVISPDRQQFSRVAESF